MTILKRDRISRRSILLRRCSQRPWSALMVLFIISTVLGGAGAAAAAEAGTNVPAFVIKSWRTIDGLPQNSVTALAQTTDGYLWVGTRGGLARFDGVRFRSYGLADGLKGLFIWSLAEDGQGGLWIGTLGGGLSHWLDGRITTWTTADGLAHNDVMALASAGPGAVWVGTKRGLQHYGPGGFTSVGDVETLRREVVALAADREGGLWVTGEWSGLYYCKAGRCELVPGPTELPKVQSYSLVVDPAGDLWVSPGNGFVFRRQRMGAWTVFTQKDGVPFQFIRSLAQGAPGEIWGASPDAGLYVFREGRFHAVAGMNSSARSVLMSREGILWVGTPATGLCRVTPKRLSAYLVGQEDRPVTVTSLAEATPGEFLVATYGNGLFRGSLDRLEPVKDVKELVDRPHLTSVLKTRAGAVWIGGAGVLVRRAPGATEFQTVSLAHNLVALCEGADGTLWLGSREGELLHLVDDKPQPVAQGSMGALISTLIRGEGTALWVATQGAGLVRWEGGRAQRWTTEEGLPTDVVRALYRDAAGTLWIGTAGGGIAWLEEGRIRVVNSQSGLSDNFISQILEDDAGNLWLGGNRGMSRVSKRELRAVASGQEAGVHPLVVDETDGMLSAECTGGTSPAGWRGASGTLYFSTMRGLAVVDPARFGPVAGPPKPLIEEVKLNGKPFPWRGGALTVPASQRELEIHYTAFNYAKPEQIHFRHRLEGANEEWTEVNGARSVRYSKLRPGDYTFQVSATNPDRHWHEAGASLAFTVLPFYWQTIWFRFLAGFALLASGAASAWLATRAKLRRAAERDRAAQAVREVQDHLNATVRENEERMALTTQAANLGIWVRDLVRNEVWATEKWRELLGFTKSERIDLDGYLQKLHPEDREAVSRILTKATERDGQYETEYRVVLPGGRLRWIASRGRVEFNGAGQPVLVRGVSLDITARKQAEAEALRQREELAHLSRVTTLSELSGSLAHELNQPLAIILTNAQAAQRFLAQEPPDVAEAREILADIVSEDQRAGEVIRRLRALLKHGETSLQPLTVNEVIEDVLRITRSDLIGRGITLHHAFARNLPQVFGDRVQLQQVLLNLILNACDAMAANPPAGRQLSLGTVHRDGAVRISVSDNGSGLPPNPERVFEPFYTTKPHGLGLGLSICRTIVAAHQGRLWAEANVAGGGATFHLELPTMAEGKP